MRPTTCGWRSPRRRARLTATPHGQIEKARNKGVTYLKGLQKESGEIPGFGGDWALTALRRGGRRPRRRQQRRQRNHRRAQLVRRSSRRRRAGRGKEPLRPTSSARR